MTQSLHETPLPMSPEDEILAALGRIEGRLDRLEAAAGELPAVAATITDVGDDLVRRAQRRGIDIDGRARHVAQLLEQLTEPARLERLERLVASSDELEGGVAALVDILDGVMSRMAARGVDVDARARQLGHILELATAPGVLDSLERLLRRDDLLAQFVDVFEGAPEMIAMGVDILDGWMAQAIAEGLDAGAIGHSLGQAMGRFVRLLQDDSFEDLMRSGVLDARTLDVIGRVARALADSYGAGEPERVGAWGMWRAARNRHIQRAVGFGVRFGERFGELLRPQLSPGAARDERR